MTKLETGAVIYFVLRVGSADTALKGGVLINTFCMLRRSDGFECQTLAFDFGQVNISLRLGFAREKMREEIGRRA